MNATHNITTTDGLIFEVALYTVCDNGDVDAVRVAHTIRGKRTEHAPKFITVRKAELDTVKTI